MKSIEFLELFDEKMETEGRKVTVFCQHCCTSESPGEF
jgi:hypothetical protein